MDKTTSEQFDCEYVVVGSGAGGGPLAANLAKAGHKVILLEAGGKNEPPDYQVPAFFSFAAENKQLSWEYFVRHYKDQEQQRRDSKFVAEHDGIFYPRSGSLGGCTSHHAMLIVYPHNSDWDRIAEITGDPSWQSGNMRKYFERLERCRHRPFRRFLKKLLGWNPTRHGFEGWLPTSVADPRIALGDRELMAAIKKSVSGAFKELNYPLKRFKKDIEALLDPNDWKLVKDNAEGIRIAPLCTSDGRRAAAREYIQEIQKAFPGNLIVKTGALASRVLFDDANRAVGVEYLEGAHLYRADPNSQANGDSGGRRTVRASREVILAAGAFNTPQLLMLSGVGPGEELTRHGIQVRVDLAGVGENLQDHYEIGVISKMKKDFSILKNATFEAPKPGQEPDPNYRQWQQGRGVYTSNGVVVAVIKKTTKSPTEPDLFIFGVLGPFKGYFPGFSKGFREVKDAFTWAILKGHPKNTAGKVTLRSTDPRDVPDINFRFFEEGNDSDGDDLESMAEGVEFARKLNSRMGHLIEEEELPGKQYGTRQEIKEFVKNEAWSHHASCTCKIGPRQDGMAVVDSDFRVHGTQGLRIVDASVFPYIPGFFIVAPIHMISEKASDVILADAGH